MFVHGGQGNVVVNQLMYDIRRGMLFFFQPYQLHRIYSEVSPACPFERSIFYIDPHVAENLLVGFSKRKLYSQHFGEGKIRIALLILKIVLRLWSGLWSNMITIKKQSKRKYRRHFDVNPSIIEQYQDWRSADIPIRRTADLELF